MAGRDWDPTASHADRTDATELVIDFGDGVSALDRTMRAITMAADGAIDYLTGLGWDRTSINLNLDMLIPCWVMLRGKRVFEVDYAVGPNGRVTIKGHWLVNVKKPGFWARLFGRT